MKLKIVTFCGCLFLMLPCVGWAQREPCPPPAYDSLFKRNVYTFVEEMPEFPEGTAALMKYISQNLTIPPIAREYGIEGRGQVTFIIEADGSIKDVIPGYKGKSNYIDEALAKVIIGMPNWKPGRCNGKAVAVRFMVPVNVHLD